MNKERRQLVFGAIAGAAMLAAEDAQSQVKQAYDAIQAVARLSDRRKIANITTPTNVCPNEEAIDGNQLSGNNRSIPTDISSVYSPKMQIRDVSKTSGDAILSVQGTSTVDPITIQNTPIPNPTVEAAQNDKIVEDDIAAQNANKWFWLTNVAAPLGAAGTIIGIGVNYIQSQRTKRAEERKQKGIERVEREKRDEDRFNDIVNKLSSVNIETRTDAAIQLRTFLDPKQKESYQRFYQQIFDLAIGHLRLRPAANPDTPELPDPFYQEIISLFLQAVPQVREPLNLQSLLPDEQLPDKQKEQEFDSIRRKYLNASGIHLDGAHLIEADLQFVYMPNASLIGALLRRANLEKVSLYRANLENADLKGANVKRAYLREAHLKGAILPMAIRDADTFGAHY